MKRLFHAIAAFILALLLPTGLMANVLEDTYTKAKDIRDVMVQDLPKDIVRQKGLDNMSVIMPLTPEAQASLQSLLQQMPLDGLKSMEINSGLDSSKATLYYIVESKGATGLIYITEGNPVLAICHGNLDNMMK